MRALKQRFDFVSELRAFAVEVATLPCDGAPALAARMNRRCAEVMKRQDPMEHGRIDPNSIFKSPAGSAVGRVEVRKARQRKPGTLGLKAA